MQIISKSRSYSPSPQTFPAHPKGDKVSKLKITAVIESQHLKMKMSTKIDTEKNEKIVMPFFNMAVDANIRVIVLDPYFSD